jgi:hypothetical protein
MNITLQERKFEEPEKLLETISDYLNEMEPSILMFVFHH